MKRSTRSDIIVLLGFLLLFSGGIGIFHGGTKAVAAAVNDDDADRWEQLAPLMMAGDIKNMARIMNGLPFEQEKRIMSRILTDSKIVLDDTKKVQLLFLLIPKVAEAGHRKELLNLLFSTMPLIEQQPLFYSAVEVDSGMIPALNEWLGTDIQKRNVWARLAIAHGIQAGRPDVVQKLLESGIVPSKMDANTLLWQVIEQTDDPRFIALLVRAGANLNDAHEGKTVLIAAVQKNKKPLVEELIKQGAFVNLIMDPSVGSALQMAVKKGFTDIDKLLRNAGARE